MAILASTIIGANGGAATTLLDEDGITYPSDTMLAWLNEALRATAFVKPDMFVKDENVTIAAGITQTLPDDGIALFSIPQNASGRVVTQVPGKLLDECNRFWPRGTQQAEVEHYTFDPRNPLRFRIYPPNDGAGVVEMVYGAYPPPVAAPEDEIPVKDTYETVLKDFVLSRAYGENSVKQDITKSTFYMQAWGNKLGIKSNAQISSAPKVASQPGVA